MPNKNIIIIYFKYFLNCLQLYLTNIKYIKNINNSSFYIYHIFI